MVLPRPLPVVPDVWHLALDRSLNLAGLTLVVCDASWRVLSVHGAGSAVRVGDSLPELSRLPLGGRAGLEREQRVEISGGRNLRVVQLEHAPSGGVLAWLHGPDADAAAPSTSRILREQYGLGTRQQQLLKLLADGLSNREIAAELGLREATVKTYLHQLYEQLGVRSRTAAIAHVRGAVGQNGTTQFR